MRFRVDDASLTASGERGERARLGLLWLEAWADPSLRERLRQQRAAEGVVTEEVEFALIRLALRAGAAAANAPMP
jgi:hypothetical protein